MYSLGLVTVNSTAKMFGFEGLYAFLHLTLQGYLAAYNIAIQNEDLQIKLVRNHQDKTEMLMVWKFYCGIVNENLKNKQLQLIMTSMAMNGMHIIHCI